MRTRLPSVTFKVSSNIAVISEVFCSFPTVLKYTSAGFFAFTTSIAFSFGFSSCFFEVF